jgi:alkylated DNA repair dioxygenase AlkB
MFEETAFQPGLFGLEPVSLIRDDEGGIRYLPGSISVVEAARWFEALRHDAIWAERKRMMYEREVDVPRLMAAYSSSDNLPSSLTQAFDAVRMLIGAPFTHVGLNLYRNGNDSVAPHSDKTERLLPKQPIAILSLGAPRRMVIRSKSGNGRALNVTLEAGSVLVMSYASQFTHEHGIPKTADVKNPRISLAFRCFEP